jgi:copper chaperone CopZ
MDRTTETLRIDGMTCGHCVAAVRTALAGLDGVEVEDLRIGEARVAYDPARTSRDALVAAVEGEGYAVQPA